MSAPELYSRTLIDLAATVSTHAPCPTAVTHQAAAHSPICGSRVEVQLSLDPAGRVTGFGYMLEACALTKSVVAVMRDAISGDTVADVTKAHAALLLLLEGKNEDARAALPSQKWEALLALSALKDYPARHNAVQLPFEAVEKALAGQPRL